MIDNGYLLKCSVCGGALIGQGAERKCKYCGAKFLVANPQMESELADANAFRECTRFDEAAALYRKIIKKYKGQDFSDVYWGLLLCEQRVMFETDEKGERFPSFYAISDDDIEDSPYYVSALQAAKKNAPEKARIFEELAGKMARVKQLYERISATSRPYDVFVCFKKTAKNGGVTKDTALAADIYTQFAKDYHIFFSERSLRDVTVREFEPNIYYALYTAKVLLLLCSKKDYVQSQWVKNEWSRFLQFSQNPSTGKVIIPIFLEDFKPSQLPAELVSMQGLKDDRMLFSTLEKTLKKIVAPVDVEKEMRARDQKWEQMLAEQQKRAEEQQKALLEEQRRSIEEQQKQLLEKVATLEKQNSAQRVEKTPVPAQKMPEQDDAKWVKLLEEQQRKNEEQQKLLLEKLAALEKQNKPERVEKTPSAPQKPEQRKTTPTTPAQDARRAYEAQQRAQRIEKTATALQASWQSGTNASQRPTGASDDFEIVGGVLKKYKGSGGNVVIPGSVTEIGRNAFGRFRKVESVKFPPKLTKIDTWAFQGSGLGATKRLVIPASVTMIGEGAFEECKMEEVVFERGSQLKTISNDAFKNATNLRKITIPASAKSIGKAAFYNCKSLSSVVFEDPKGWGAYESAFSSTCKTVSEDLSNPSQAAKAMTYYHTSSWRK